jgi:hypothetical protein
MKPKIKPPVPIFDKSDDKNDFPVPLIKGKIAEKAAEK